MPLFSLSRRPSLPSVVATPSTAASSSAAPSIAAPSSIAAAPPAAAPPKKAPPPKQSVELGLINYHNLDGSHGDLERALLAAQRTGRPIFANFVEWPGWHGCREAGKIFADPAVVKAAEELFTPVAFNTYDRYSSGRNEPFRLWSGRLAGSWWGYLRLVTPDGRNVVAGTRQITGAGQLEEVKMVMRQALEAMDLTVPAYLK